MPQAVQTRVCMISPAGSKRLAPQLVLCMIPGHLFRLTVNNVSLYSSHDRALDTSFCTGFADRAGFSYAIGTLPAILHAVHAVVHRLQDTSIFCHAVTCRRCWVGTSAARGERSW